MKKLIKVVGAIIENDNNEFLNHTHEYDDVIVNLITVKCTLISGVPKAQEHFYQSLIILS